MTTRPDPRARTAGPARPHPWAPTPAEAAVLLAAGAALLLALRPASAPDLPPPAGAPRSEYAHLVDPRTAGEGELVLLPGIGRQRALRILEARARAGPSAPAARIWALSGLSPAVLSTLAPWVAGPPAAPLPEAPVRGAAGLSAPRGR